MIRLFVINHVTGRSGGEIVLLRHLRLLNKEKFKVIAALPSKEGMLPEELARLPNVEVRVVESSSGLLKTKRMDGMLPLLSNPQTMLDFWSMVRRHADLIRREQIDVVLTNSIKSHYYGSLAAGMARRPVVWILHEYLDAHYSPLWTRASLTLTANRLANKVICVSRASEQALVREGVKSKKATTIYSPPIATAELERSTHSLRDELGVSPGTQIVTMIGRITVPKGQLQFVQAIGKLGTDKDVVYLIVGDSLYGSFDDDYKEQVIKAIEQLPQPGRVRMLGMRTDVLDIIAQSDIIVFHSLWPEGFPMSVAEAMQLGKPVIGTPVGGTSEMIQDGVTGRLVAPEDTAALALVIAELLDDPAQAQTLGKQGLQHIRQLMTPGNTQQLEQVLADAVR